MIRRVSLSWLACGVLAAMAGCTSQAPAEPVPATCATGPVVRAPYVEWMPRDDPRQSVVAVLRLKVPTLQLLRDSRPAPDRWATFLTVRVVREGDGKTKAEPLPPLLGTYRIVGDAIRFEPRFPLEPGIRYRAEFDPRRLRELEQSLARGPADRNSQPDALPASRRRSSSPSPAPPRPHRRPSRPSIRRGRSCPRTCCGSTSTSPPP